jgi:hypothetical protein
MLPKIYEDEKNREVKERQMNTPIDIHLSGSEDSDVVFQRTKTRAELDAEYIAMHPEKFTPDKIAKRERQYLEALRLGDTSTPQSEIDKQWWEDHWYTASWRARRNAVGNDAQREFRRQQMEAFITKMKGESIVKDWMERFYDPYAPI